MISIDIFSDVVCPWCFIGKRNLEAAISVLAKKGERYQDIQTNWRSFQLNPQLPTQGIARSEYTSKKFGGEERAKIFYERIKESGQSVGLAFDFEKIKVQPNSARMHALVYAAEEIRKDHELVERLFKTFFIDGVDLSKRENMFSVAQSAGLGKEIIDKVLDEDYLSDKVHEDMQQAAHIGIQGVPFFVINQTIGLSGAQPPESIVSAVEQALRDGQSN
ncbi:MAG: DsbA family oxidoreductase [Betaproteobacteria bacterium]|nr:DsbA family oxidoreductase [Betaproteobacteria bacterium]